MISANGTTVLWSRWDFIIWLHQTFCFVVFLTLNLSCDASLATVQRLSQGLFWCRQSALFSGIKYTRLSRLSCGGCCLFFSYVPPARIFSSFCERGTNRRRGRAEDLPALNIELVSLGVGHFTSVHLICKHVPCRDRFRLLMCVCPPPPTVFTFHYVLNTKHIPVYITRHVSIHLVMKRRRRSSSDFVDFPAPLFITRVLVTLLLCAFCNRLAVICQV